MGIAIFFLLALAAAGVIVYPLLPGRVRTQPAPAVTDEDIERAVRNLRRARRASGPLCPSCGKAYQPGDRFCVQCGSELPQATSAGPAPTESLRLCPSCGAAIREGDRFCARCGQTLSCGEAM